MRNCIITNRCFAYSTRYFRKIMQDISLRTTYLRKLVKSRRYLSATRLAGRYAGRRPSWHFENNLHKRVIKAGYSKYVQQFAPINQSDFEEQLHKAERLMSKTVNFKGDYRRLLEAAVRVREKCKFPTELFKPTTVRFAAENQLNKRASSGYPYFRRKGQVLNKLILQCNDLLKNRRKGYFTWPLTRGFRLQIRESKGKLSRKIRVMYPYPGVLTLLENTFVIPFVNHFTNTDTFYVIGENGSGLRERIISRFMPSRFKHIKRITSTDVTAFDQSMVNEIIVLSFWILRSQLQLDENQRWAFDEMVKYFCTSIAVSKSKGIGSYAFVKHHGVPSGSGFTNMIDSIGHAIMLEYCYPNITDSCLICGDDNVFNSTSYDVDLITQIFKEVFNMTINPEKTEHFRSWRRIYFLGFNLIDGYRHVSPLLVINQMLWHTDFIIDLDLYERELARGASVLLNGANGKVIFKRIFPDVIEQIGRGIDVRYYYLYGTQPPSTMQAITGALGKQTETVPGINSSLSEHLERGYLIR